MPLSLYTTLSFQSKTDSQVKTEKVKFVFYIPMDQP